MKTVFDKLKHSLADIRLEKIHAQYAWSHWLFGSTKYPLLVQVEIHYLDGSIGRGGNLQLDIPYLSSKFAYPSEGETWYHFKPLRTPRHSLFCERFSLTHFAAAVLSMSNPQLEFEIAWSMDLCNSHSDPVYYVSLEMGRDMSRIKNLYPYQLKLLEKLPYSAGGMRYGNTAVLSGRRPGVSSLYKAIEETRNDQSFQNR